MLGAWQYPDGTFKVYKWRMGTAGGTDDISLGIKAIEIELNFLGLKDNLEKVDGTFDWGTRSAVKRFQTEEGLDVDAKVGPATAKHLFFHRIQETQLELGIPDNLLFGLCMHESRMDPGVRAPSANGSTDRGLAQINSETTYDGSTDTPIITDDDAFDPTFCIPYAGLRLKSAYVRFKGDCKGGAWNAAILSHNTPVGAAKYCDTGEYATEKNRLYVEKVRAAALEVPS